MHFLTHTPWAGSEVAHLHPFRPALMKLMKIAELTDWQDLRERFKQWPILAGMESMRTSSDGLVRIDLIGLRAPLSAATPSLCNSYACV